MQYNRSMRQKRLLWDLDGVLADWTAGVAILFGRDIADLRAADDTGDLAAALGLASKSAIWARINRAGQDWWANLPPYPDALDMWKRLKPSDVEMGVLTTSGETTGCIEGKRAWIRRHLGSQTRWAIATTKHWCAHPFTMLVDDRARVLDPFMEAGGQGVLMPRNLGPERLAAWEKVVAWAQPVSPFGPSKADFTQALAALELNGLVPRVEGGRIVGYSYNNKPMEDVALIPGSRAQEALEVLNSVFGTLTD